MESLSGVSRSGLLNGAEIRPAFSILSDGEFHLYFHLCSAADLKSRNHVSSYESLACIIGWIRSSICHFTAASPKSNQTAFAEPSGTITEHVAMRFLVPIARSGTEASAAWWRAVRDIICATAKRIRSTRVGARQLLPYANASWSSNSCS